MLSLAQAVRAAARTRIAIYDRPLAAQGLISYRCRGRFGWIMIGARNDAEAMREAWRSCAEAKREDLERWDGERYCPL